MLQPEYWGLHNSTMVTTAVSDIQTLVPFILGISVANFYAISHTIVSKGGINLVSVLTETPLLNAHISGPFVCLFTQEPAL